MSKKKCLIIETHSDDSFLSAYGFLNKYKDEYDYFFGLVLASEVNKISREDRIKEYINYVNSMNGYYLGVLPGLSPFDADTKLDTIPRGEVVKFIEDLIDEVKPDLMLVTGRSPHLDHTITYEAAISALRPGRTRPKKVLVMENSSNTFFDPCQNKLDPNVYCSLTEEQIDNKVEVFKRLFPSQSRWAYGLKEFAKYRGIESKSEYCEAFYQLYEVI